MEQLILIADLAGTAVFAVTGAVSAVKLRLDLLGVVVFACTVGVGGGMLRDVIIGATPVAALQNETYLILCIIVGLLIFILSPLIFHHKQIIQICDAFGLGIFTALGAAKGAQFGLGPIGMTLCGVLSAAGGGVLRDVMARRIPAVLTSDFYATASLIGGLLYWPLSRAGFLRPGNLFIVIAALVTLIRLSAICFHFHLPSAHCPADEEERS